MSYSRGLKTWDLRSLLGLFCWKREKENRFLWGGGGRKESRSLYENKNTLWDSFACTGVTISFFPSEAWLHLIWILLLILQCHTHCIDVTQKIQLDCPRPPLKSVLELEWDSPCSGCSKFWAFVLSLRPLLSSCNFRACDYGGQVDLGTAPVNDEIP